MTGITITVPKNSVCRRGRGSTRIVSGGPLSSTSGSRCVTCRGHSEIFPDERNYLSMVAWIPHILLGIGGSETRDFPSLLHHTTVYSRNCWNRNWRFIVRKNLVPEQKIPANRFPSRPSSNLNLLISVRQLYRLHGIHNLCPQQHQQHQQPQYPHFDLYQPSPMAHRSTSARDKASSGGSSGYCSTPYLGETDRKFRLQ